MSLLEKCPVPLFVYAVCHLAPIHEEQPALVLLYLAFVFIAVFADIFKNPRTNFLQSHETHYLK